LRPAELAADDTASLGVVQHALGWAEGQGEQYGAVCLLQPTSPLRTAEEIDGCIDLIGSTGADSAVTVLPVPDKYNPHWVYEPDANGRLVLSTGEAEPITRRQILPPAFHREGSVYVTRRNVLVAGSLYGRSVVGYLVHEDDSVNIDTPDDLVRAERRLAARCSVSAAARA
jgi:CMP-N-acetylneuraminic acid synthetase